MGYFDSNNSGISRWKVSELPDGGIRRTLDTSHPAVPTLEDVPSNVQAEKPVAKQPDVSPQFTNMSLEDFTAKYPKVEFDPTEYRAAAQSRIGKIAGDIAQDVLGGLGRRGQVNSSIGQNLIAQKTGSYMAGALTDLESAIMQEKNRVDQQNFANYHTALSDYNASRMAEIANMINLGTFNANYTTPPSEETPETASARLHVRSLMTGDSPYTDAFISSLIDTYGAEKVSTLGKNELTALWNQSVNNGTFTPITKNTYVTLDGVTYTLGADGQYYTPDKIPTGYFLQGNNQIIYNGDNPDLAGYKGQVVGTVDERGNAVSSSRFSSPDDIAITHVRGLMTGDNPKADTFISSIIEKYGPEKVSTFGKQELATLWNQMGL